MITVTLKNPKDSTSYSLSPMAITIPRGELNENLQHVAQSCQLTAAYEPELLEILALRTFVKATVEDETGTLFTGIIDTGATWTDNGFPTPIDSLQLKINDNTYLLEKQAEDEVALINTTLKNVIERICSICNVTISPGTTLPVTPLKAFIMDTGTSYLQTINNLLFQHELAFIFTGTGELSLIDFSTPPEELLVIGQDRILTGFSPTRTAKKYGAVKIGYTSLTKKNDQQVYFEGNDLGEDNKVVPITVRPGQYYPYESEPIQEDREGQVYQEFSEGYAESYQAYNGETKYRRSQKTSLLYTENQRLVQDWEGSILIDRTQFQARRASVRLYNNGSKDANLLQLAIRADAWYREPTSYVTAGSGNEYLYEGEYLYTPEAAEKLSKTLSRFFLGGNFKISGRLTEPLGIGEFVHIDTGLSGFQANALCLSCSFEPESEIYTVSLITYGAVAINVNRYKALASKGDSSLSAIVGLSQKIEGVITGEDEEIGPPDIPQGLVATAEKDRISISWQPPAPGLKNIIKQYVLQIKRANTWDTEWTSSGTSSAYIFYRAEDGYPEADKLRTWKIRIKAVNIYGKESEGWGGGEEGVPVNTDTYGTWELLAPTAIPQIRDRHITLMLSQPPRADNRQVYGDIKYDIWIRRPDVDTQSDVWYTPGMSLNPYPENLGDGTEKSNELNYKLDTTTPETRGEMYVQTMPLKGQGGDGKSIENTLYLFKVVARNEAGFSFATIVQATALCTNIVDLVNANISQKEAYIPDLSAISANLGSINQGSMGNDNNRWDLSTFIDTRGIQHWEGLFRMGGNKQFVHGNPIINDIGQIVDYEIIFKVGSFEISSTASKIQGEIIVMDTQRSWERTRITPTGTYYEFKASEEQGWVTVAKQETRGLMSQLMYSSQSVILTNASITKRRRDGIDLGRPYLSDSSLVYHFDEDFFDQYGGENYTLDGSAQLVDMNDNTPLSVIDFTPAILSVAPYSEIGKSAYGQYAIHHDLGDTNVYTVDFWIQYIWAENQVLLDIGSNTDKIQVICSSGEPNYNEPLPGEPPYNWEIETADQLPYNVAAGEAVYLSHIGQSQSSTINFKSVDFSFLPNTWEHIAVVLTDTEIKLFVRDRQFSFNRYNTAPTTATANLNGHKMSFQLDELLVDTTVARDFDDFVEGTHDRIPWGKLDHKKKHFILNADDADNITGNVFSSKAFEQAVQKIIDKNKEQS